jgi:glycosyltransferase involved in cell wall biosynthesis
MLVIGSRQNAVLDLPQDVPVRYLGKKHARNAIGVLTRMLKTENPDVIYSAKISVNLIAVLANQLTGQPGCIIPSQHNHLSVPLLNQPPFRKWKLRLMLFLTRYAYHWVDRVVFVSKESLQDGCKYFRLPNDLATVIYNPIVDDTLFDMSEKAVEHPWFAKERKEPIILAVGRLTKQKGFPYLLKAFYQVRNLLPARLIVIGEGRDDLRLTNLAETLGIKDDMAFLGFQSNPYRFMARADLFVLSSLWEGLPTVLVEAMACRTPVVSTRCPAGPEEIIIDGINGLLVPPADPTALAEAIVKVLTNPKMARRMALAGKQRAECFRAEKIVRQYEQLFKSVVEERSSGV